MIPYLTQIKWAVLIASVALAGYLGFDKVYSMGFNKANAECNAKLAVIQEQLTKAKTEVEILSDLLEADRVKDIAELQKTLDDYLKAFKEGKRPVTVITKSGACVPSNDFIDAFNDIIRRANATGTANSAPAK